WRGVEPALDDLDEFRFVESDAAAGPGQRERRPDDRRQADVGQRLERLDQSLFDMAALALGLARIPGGLEAFERALFILGRKLLRLDLGDPGRMLVAVGLLEVGRVGKR